MFKIILSPGFLTLPLGCWNADNPTGKQGQQNALLNSGGNVSRRRIKLPGLEKGRRKDNQE
jgi:hypothetical protein